MISGCRNHRFVREHLDAVSIISARFQDVVASDTPGKYRSMMKGEFNNKLYHQRNKNETVMSVIKRMFGEHVRSRNVKMQNRELIFRVIAYNMHRLTVLIVWFLQSLISLLSFYLRYAIINCSILTIHLDKPYQVKFQ
jgi:hypothetical protein